MPVVMNADRVAKSLTRIAHEILERNNQIEEVALVGIRRRGVPLAQRIAVLRTFEGLDPSARGPVDPFPGRGGFEPPHGDPLPPPTH